MNWIKIEDQQPEQEQRVWSFFYITGVEESNYKTLDDEHLGTMDCFYNDAGFLCDDVSHWMPVEASETTPEPPSDFTIKNTPQQLPIEEMAAMMTEKGMTIDNIVLPDDMSQELKDSFMEIIGQHLPPIEKN